MNCPVVSCEKSISKRGLCEFHYRRQLTGRKLGTPFYSQDYYVRGKFDFKHKSIRSWSRSIRRYFDDRCMMCGWYEASCDCHHIVPRREGGENTLFNAAVLCPNHHKLADQGKIDRMTLQELNLRYFNKKVIEA